MSECFFTVVSRVLGPLFCSTFRCTTAVPLICYRTNTNYQNDTRLKGPYLVFLPQFFCVLLLHFEHSSLLCGVLCIVQLKVQTQQLQHSQNTPESTGAAQIHLICRSYIFITRCGQAVMLLAHMAYRGYD